MGKKLIDFSVLLSMLLIPTNKVSAETVEESFYERKYLQEECITKIKGTSKIGEQLGLLKRSGNNEIGYSIDLWNPIGSKAMKDKVEEERIETQITEEVLKKKNRIQEETTNENRIIKVPNTSIHQKKPFNMGPVLLLIGFILIRKEDNHEKN